MKNLIDSQIYQQVFDEVSISADSKAAGRWETNKGGEYFAAGVGSSITGRGADLLIIDDPHSEQDALSKQRLTARTNGTPLVLVNVYSRVVLSLLL